eukprot:3391059-Prymnesium_polylepis.1
MKRLRTPLSPIANRGVDAEPVPQRCGCFRVPRRGWTTESFLTNPIGVHEYRTPDGQAAQRFHTVLVWTDGSAIELGCFGTAREAADAWDAEVRRRGGTLTNAPRPGERSILTAVRFAFVAAAGFPYPPTDRQWRERQFAQLMQSARSGGVERVWASERDVQQNDHASAPGTQLAFSCAAARGIEPGARAALETKPSRLSSVLWGKCAPCPLPSMTCALCRRARPPQTSRTSFRRARRRAARPTGARARPSPARPPILSGPRRARAAFALSSSTAAIRRCSRICCGA